MRTAIDNKIINMKNEMLCEIISSLNIKNKRLIFKYLRENQEHYTSAFDCDTNLFLPIFGITVGEFALFGLFKQNKSTK